MKGNDCAYDYIDRFHDSSHKVALNCEGSYIKSKKC